MRLHTARSALTVRVGCYTRVELSGDIPIAPGTFAVRAAIAHDERDGYTQNRLLGRDEDAATATLAKLSAVISPSDRVEIVLRAEYTDSEATGPPWIVTDDHPVPPLLLSTGNPGGILSQPGDFYGPGTCEEALGLNLSRPGVWSEVHGHSSSGAYQIEELQARS